MINGEIAFRVDSGLHIGIGHLVRCLNFAQSLAETGLTPFFLTIPHEGHRVDLIKSSGFRVTEMPGIAGKLKAEERDDYKKWIAHSELEDAQITERELKALKNLKLIVVDHYALGERWESHLENNKIFVIDDLERVHHCDFILDQNYTSERKNYNNTKHNGSLIEFLGPRYALLNKEFELFRQRGRVQSDVIEKVLVFFGGGDATAETLNFVTNLPKTNFENKQFSIVLNSSHKTFPEVEKIVNGLNNVKLLSYVSNMAELMASADLFIGASGSTSWERCCLGVPAIVISTADNQVKIAEELQKFGAILYAGKSSIQSKSNWVDVFKLIDNKSIDWIAMSHKAKMLTEGNGPKLILDELKRQIFV